MEVQVVNEHQKEVVSMMGKNDISYKAQTGCARLTTFFGEPAKKKEEPKTQN